MSIAVVVSGAEGATRLVHWAALIGRARECGVVVLETVPGAGGPSEEDVPLDGEGTDADPVVAAVRRAREIVENPPELEVVRLEGLDPTAMVLAQLSRRGTRLLLLGHAKKPSPDDPAGATSLTLLREAPCHAMLIRAGEDDAETAERILVATSGGPNADIGLQVAADLADASDGRATALYVQTQRGEDAREVGREILRRAVARAVSRNASRIRNRVILADDPREALAAEAAEGYDLVLIGTTNRWVDRRLLFGALPDSLFTKPEGVSVAVVRRALPIGRRISGRARRALEAVVPQLGRAERVALAETLSSSSRFDFDFVFLTCLSTLIASLGLVAGNAAVVIGAMLVAPLMTPLIGAGHALVQGNLHFLRDTTKAVALGFLLALGVAILVGVVFPPEIRLDVKDEITSRGGMDVPDLAVAFFSGMAAAYCLARPGLSAALPGVAIAASLVPPIGAAGLALVAGKLELAAGAALLFATNIVAIVLGAAISLYAGGVRSRHLHGRQGEAVRRFVLLVYLLLAVIAIAIGYLVRGT